MTDQQIPNSTHETDDTQAAAATAPKIEDMTLDRVFKIGSQTIYENEVTYGLTNEQVREALKSAYPEIANATIGTRNENGQEIIDFLPQPGRKG